MTARQGLRYAAMVAGYSWRWHRRHLATWLATAAALGVILSVVAAAQLVVWIGERSLNAQLQSASEMQVFLVDTATPAQRTALQSKLQAVPGVRRVAYRSQADAMALASRDPQLAPLARASEGNPFPASYVLEMRDPTVSEAVLKALARDPAVDPRVPASYTYSQERQLSSALGAIQVATLVGGAIGVGAAAFVALMLLRSEVRARHEELRVLALVGVPRATIRTPLVVQALSLAVAGSVVAALTLLLMDTHLVPAINQVLPFLHVDDPIPVTRVLSLATLVASCSALVPCALLVRLPR